MKWTASKIIHMFKNLQQGQGLLIKHDKIGTTNEISFPKAENIELSIEATLPNHGRNSREFLVIENTKYKERFVIPIGIINKVKIIDDYENYVETWINSRG